MNGDETNGRQKGFTEEERETLGNTIERPSLHQLSYNDLGYVLELLNKMGDYSLYQLRCYFEEYSQNEDHWRSRLSRLKSQRKKDFKAPKKEPVRTNIYLMLCKRNNMVKIGRSVDPGIRERTLQSQEPSIELLYSQEADIALEWYLHKFFHCKRTRGEWFDLTTDEISTAIALIGLLEPLNRATRRRFMKLHLDQQLSILAEQWSRFLPDPKQPEGLRTTGTWIPKEQFEEASYHSRKIVSLPGKKQSH